MAKTNIMGHEDMPAGALRQRRDLYAISIGLSIFYLAGGQLLAGSQQGILGMTLERPWIVLAAAWIGFFYFLLRLSLFKPYAAALVDFKLEVQHQAMFSDEMRGALRLLVPKENRDFTSVVNRLDRGLIPIIRFDTDPVQVDFTHFFKSVADQAIGKDVSPLLGAGKYPLPAQAQSRFLDERRIATFRAMTKEHTFTNYLLPYYFALLPLFLGIHDCTSRIYHWLSAL